MSAESTPLSLRERLQQQFGERLLSLQFAQGETTIEVSADHWWSVCETLQASEQLHFEQLIDLCGVDYLSYGQVEWDTTDVSSQGFSRAVEGFGPGRFRAGEVSTPESAARRFAVVVHLMSLKHNARVRVRCYCPDDELPVLPTLTNLWRGAEWFEREAFDLFGIVFDGHNDLRRILTDYGFVGHPFRKDFPLIGNVEVRYDPIQGRVIYEPVSIEPRVSVPRVVRQDSRYEQAQAETQAREPKANEAKGMGG